MTNQRRPRGTGRIFQPRGCARWYIRYFRNGKRITESTGSTDRKVAEQKLRQRLAQIATGTFTGPHVERIRVEDLYEPFIADLKRRGKGTDQPARRWKLHLEPFFGWRRVQAVGTDQLNEYVNQRRDDGAMPATVNREIAALRSMFRLGYYSQPPKVTRLPKFPHLEEDNVRTGFVDSAAYDKLAAAANQLWMRALLEIYYTYGWRLSEVLSLQVRQVDFVANVIRLDVGTTKNKEGREVHMTPTVRALLAECCTGKKPDGAVFTRKRKDGSHHPVLNFRKAWRNLCKAAGVPDLLVHDLRRSAAVTLRRSGVAEEVIMKMGGWKTSSVFKRYSIVSQSDISEALLKREALLKLEKGYKVGEKASQDDSGKQTRLN